MLYLLSFKNKRTQRYYSLIIGKSVDPYLNNPVILTGIMQPNRYTLIVIFFSLFPFYFYLLIYSHIHTHTHTHTHTHFLPVFFFHFLLHPLFSLLCLFSSSAYFFSVPLLFIFFFFIRVSLISFCFSLFYSFIFFPICVFAFSLIFYLQKY